jgi:hypothetical protein
MVPRALRPATAIMVIVLLAGCAGPVATPTGSADAAATPTESPPTLTGADAVEAEFLGRMADPAVTYAVATRLELDPAEGDAEPGVEVQWVHDVKGSDYAGHMQLGGTSLDGWFTTQRLIFLDGQTYLDRMNGFGREVSTPTAPYRPNPYAGLTAADLADGRETDDGMYAFTVEPWIAGDPTGELLELDVLAGRTLPSTEVEEHETELIVDADGVPHRLSSTFVGDGLDGRLEVEFVAFGLYVTIQDPTDGWPHATSHWMSENDTWVPWREVKATGDSATLEVTFDGHGLGGGMEGDVFFLESEAGGNETLDVKMDPRGDTHQIPVGPQTLTPSVRTCSGNCGVLDARSALCAVEASIEPGARYELAIVGTDWDEADCTLTETG